MFLDVLIIYCAKIIEAFNIFEYLTSIRFEFIGNSNNSEMDVIIFRSLIDKFKASTNGIITDISH